MSVLPAGCKALICMLFLLPASLAVAQPDCPPGNLLAGKAPVVRAVVGAARTVDGVAPVEGGAWKTNLTAVMGTADAQLTWDLGQPTRVDALAVQADNNDTYEVYASVDGTTFHPLWTVPESPAMGMRFRVQAGLNAELRYLRISNPAGDEAYSLGEVLAFCARPAVWPPQVTRKEAEITKAPEDDRKDRMAHGKMSLGLLALLVFAGLAVSRRDPTPGTRLGLQAWGFLGFASFIAFDKLGYSAQASVSVGHVAAALAALGLFGRERFPLASVGRGIAGLAGVATLLFCGLRVRAEIPEALREQHTVLANLHWIGLIATAAFLAFGFMRKRLPRAVEHAALLAVVVGSTLTWTNFWTFHGSRAVHYWDSFHYYMGSKYFEETRYHLLYQCSAIGEVDDGLEAEFAKRQIRDLRDNSLGPAAPALARDEECRKNFTPERWAAFRQDLRLFRSQMGDAWWQKMFKDHGYNASPVWNMMGHVFANWAWQDHIPPAGLENSVANRKGKSEAEQRAIRDRFTLTDVPAFKDRVERLALLDAAFYFGLFALIWWAFGLQTCALAMAILAAGYPWAYFWTGGSYGRVAWVFMAVAGVCLMKKGFPVAGGFAVIWSALDRVFPGALAAGVGLKTAWNFIKHRTMIRNHRRILLGAVLGMAVLIPASLPYADGLGAWKEFFENSMKHRDTPLTNHMGLPALVAFDPKAIARATKNDKLDDPFAVWKEQRKEILKDRKLVFYGLFGALMALILVAARRMEDWEATAISGLVIIGFFDLTCYYYNFIVLWAATGMRQTRYLVVLMLMAVISQVIQLKVGWYDEQYLWESLLVLLSLVYIVADFAWTHRKKGDVDFERPADTLNPAQSVQTLVR
jgi:hypothetical protein